MWSRMIGLASAGVHLAVRRFTLTNLLADLDSIVNSGPTPVVLVGHSFGALLVSAFAHLYPEKVLGLVSIDPISLATCSAKPAAAEPLSASVALSSAAHCWRDWAGAATLAGGAPEPSCLHSLAACRLGKAVRL